VIFAKFIIILNVTKNLNIIKTKFSIIVEFV